jgi:hypothetical protein
MFTVTEESGAVRVYRSTTRVWEDEELVALCGAAIKRKVAVRA